MLRNHVPSLFVRPTHIMELMYQIEEKYWYIKFNSPVSQLSFCFLNRIRDICTEEDCGFFGMVMRGYFKQPEEGSEPKLAVKRFLTACEGNNHGFMMSMIQREVICHRVLDRQSYSFLIGNVAYVMYNWQSGCKLYDWFVQEVNIDASRVLQAILSLLQQLKKLHDQLIMHGDMHAENIIYNTANNTLSLIDFGSASINAQKESFDASRDMNGVKTVCEQFIKCVGANDRNLQLLITLTEQVAKTLCINEVIVFCEQSIATASRGPVSRY